MSIPSNLRSLPDQPYEEHLSLSITGIAEATQKELARQIKYLKVENEILRSKLPTRIAVTPKERQRLVKFAGKLTAKMLKGLVSIVHLDTVLSWVRVDRQRPQQSTESQLESHPKSQFCE